MAMSNQLLSRHDGNLPSDLALLGHLYLLELLSEPARLRSISPIVSSGGGLRDRGETVRAMAGGSAFRNSED